MAAAFIPGVAGLGIVGYNLYKMGRQWYKGLGQPQSSVQPNPKTLGPQNYKPNDWGYQNYQNIHSSNYMVGNQDSRSRQVYMSNADKRFKRKHYK